MARIVWDRTGEKKFEAGIDHVVLYPLDTTTGEYTPGEAWNGITSISETPEGAEPDSQYADNIKYLTLRSAEELNGTIEAYTYPDGWGSCDGSAEPVPGVVVYQQTRKTFGLSYRTKIGNDVDGQDHGYKLHLLYGATVSPSERTYETINDSPEPGTFSWEFNTVPVNVSGHNMTSLLTIDSTKVDTTKLAALEDILYGSDAAGAAEDGDTTGGDAARLPMPDEVIALLSGQENQAYSIRMRSMLNN